MHATLQQLTDWLGLDSASVRQTEKGETALTGVSTDTRTLAAGNLYIPLIGERFDGHDFIREAVEAGAGAVMCQQDREVPEVDCPVIVVRDTLEALQRLARVYRRHLGIPVIAVTGSNGKTTTKDLIAAVLSVKWKVHKTKGNLNNHIGLPLSLLSMEEDTDMAVVEMGMNHAGEIELLSRIATPDIAVITNVGDAHMEFFSDRRGIARAKLEIVAGLNRDGVLFLNGDDPLLGEEGAHFKGDVRKVGFSPGCEEGATDIRMKATGTQFTATRDGLHYHIPALGKHNVLNALFAIAVGRHMGLTGLEMADGLKSATLSGRRLELRETPAGMWIVDDSYNANPIAVKAGIEALVELEGKPRKWVLLGDILELGEREESMHRDVGAFVGDKPVEYIFTVGRRARWIHEAALDVRRDEGHVIHFETVEEAIRELKRVEDPNVALLVKASRGMALDRVVEALCTSRSEL